jgi:hypothetical protein
LLMGRPGKGGHYLVGRLERADVPNPTLGLVADFLRACRAGFDDLSDLLSRYTSQPTVPDRLGRVAVEQVAESLPPKIGREVRRRDRGEVKASELTGRRPPTPEQRQARARRSATVVWWRQRVRRRVIDVCQEHHWSLGLLPEEYLKKHGEKVWSILWKTRGKPEAMRQELLEAADAALVGGSTLDPAHVRAVRDAVVQVFLTAETGGKLDSPLTA